MPTDDRRWTDADRDTAARAVHDYACTGDDCSWSEEPRACDLTEFAGFGEAVLDALVARRWRPPPPAPDGIHWRSVGCTIYHPYGDLAGMMRTPETAAAVVAVLNARADEDEGDADAD